MDNNSAKPLKRRVLSNLFLSKKAHASRQAQSIFILTYDVADIKRIEGNTIIMCIKTGIKFTAIKKLESGLNVSQKEIASLLSITVSTLTRRKKAGLLNMMESDRVIRFARLKDLALDLMQGDDQAAIAWLRTPQTILSGDCPLYHAKTEVGAREIEDLIGRLKCGVFS